MTDLFIISKMTEIKQGEEIFELIQAQIRRNAVIIETGKNMDRICGSIRNDRLKSIRAQLDILLSDLELLIDEDIIKEMYGNDN